VERVKRVGGAVLQQAADVATGAAEAVKGTFETVVEKVQERF
jgi:hypothetical protein